MRRRELLQAGLAAAAGFCVGMTPLTASALAYRPPRLSGPYVIRATAGEAVRYPRGPVDAAVAEQVPGLPWLWYFRPDVDVVIVWPDEPMQIGGTISVIGGRHVRSIGGHWISTGGSGAMLAFANQMGSAFVEGAHIDCRGDERDGVVTRWFPEVATAMGTGRKSFPSITMQRCRVEGVAGTVSTVHGDCYQSQCVVDRIRIERCTLESAYQCIFPLTSKGGPKRGLHIDRVNCRWHQGRDSKGFIAAYLYDGSRERRTTGKYPVRLSGFWAGEMSRDFVWAERVTSPHVLHSWGPRLRRDRKGAFLDYSRTNLDIRGIVRRGTPPGGDFAKARDVGLNYRSPWPVQ